MAKVTKERVANICKRVNQGMSPSIAARAEGLGGTYLTPLKEAGILFKDPITGNWQGMLRIHDERFDKFVSLRKTYYKQHSNPKKKREPVRITPKVGMFRRIWNSIFG